MRGLIVLCGEHGFCGGFNEKLLESVFGSLKDTELYVVGSRGALLAQERGIAVAWSAAMATNIGTVATVAHVVAEALYDRLSRGALVDVTMSLARYGGHGHFAIEREVLLPLDLGRFRGYLTGPRR